MPIRALASAVAFAGASLMKLGENQHGHGADHANLGESLDRARFHNDHYPSVVEGA